MTHSYLSFLFITVVFISFLCIFFFFLFFAFTNVRGICTCQALMWIANNFLIFHLNDNFIISSHLCILHFYVFNLLDCHLIAYSFDTVFRLIISTPNSY